MSVTDIGQTDIRQTNIINFEGLLRKRPFVQQTFYPSQAGVRDLDIKKKFIEITDFQNCDLSNKSSWIINFISIQKIRIVDPSENLWFFMWSDLLNIGPRGVWVRCRTTFLYCGEYRVVETYRFGVENVLNVKSKISAFQNIQKIWKRLSIEKVTKDLVSDFRIQKSHVTFTMHVPCMVYMGTDVWYTW